MSAVSQGWRLTGALIRAALVSTLGILLAVAFGRPDLLVLAVPLLVHAVMALARPPAMQPRPQSALMHTTIREGVGTVSRTRLSDAADVEHAVVVLTRHRWWAAKPASGVVGTSASVPADQVTIDVPFTSLRWGRRILGDGLVGATSRWGGHFWGPVELTPAALTTLPMPETFDSRAPAPHPIGLVGTHPARRPGDGNELSSIRPFAPGDRLRRVQWRVSLRTGTLHVTSTVAEEDASVLLVVDSGVEVGVSGGVHGHASTPDVAVRAAGAVAEHYLVRGDRVGLRLLGSTHRNAVPAAAGRRHLRRVLETLAHVVPGEHPDVDPSRLRFQAPA